MHEEILEESFLFKYIYSFMGTSENNIMWMKSIEELKNFSFTVVIISVTYLCDGNSWKMQITWRRKC